MVLTFFFICDNSTSVWQAREAGAMCALFYCFKNTQKRVHWKFIQNVRQHSPADGTEMLVLGGWQRVSRAQESQEWCWGRIMPSMLVLVPSYVPQCVEIFNGSNLDVGPVYASQIKKLRKRFLVEPPPLWTSSYTHLLYKAQDPFKHMHAVQ